MSDVSPRHMQQFEIYTGTTLIGHSSLEFGDPPMGVAGGRFSPLPAYETIRNAVVSASETDQSHLHLSAKSMSGLTLPAEGGVQIIDFSTELGDEGLQIHVLGIGYPLYQELFPSHVLAYENQFKNVG